MTRILVLGATGLTGAHVLAQAIERGHSVTAFVREPQRVAIRSDRLRVITGDVTRDGSALAAAVQDQDVVISTLGAGKSFAPHGLIAQSTPNIVRAMEAHDVRRLIFTSAFGVGDTYQDIPIAPRIFVRSLLKNIYADKAAGEATIRRSPLDWTIVYPSGLTDGPPTGRWRADEHLALRGFPRIARADVAAFLLSQIEDPTYVRKGVMITSM